MTLIPSGNPKERLRAGFSRTGTELDQRSTFLQVIVATIPRTRLMAEAPMAVSRAGAPNRIAMKAMIGRKTRSASMGNEGCWCSVSGFQENTVK